MARSRNRRMKSKLLALNMDRQKRAVEQLLQDQQKELIPHLKMLESLSRAKGMSFGSRVLLEVDGVLVPGSVKSKCTHFDGSIDVLTDVGETHVYCEPSRVVLQQMVPKPLPVPVPTPMPATVPAPVPAPVAAPVIVVPHPGSFVPMYHQPHYHHHYPHYQHVFDVNPFSAVVY